MLYIELYIQTVYGYNINTNYIDILDILLLALLFFKFPLYLPNNFGMSLK